MELFQEQVRTRPEGIALVEGMGRRCRITSYAELDRRSRQISRLLFRSGFRAGDVVLVFQPMSLELYAILLGVFRLGLVAMFVDPSSGKRHLERCCELTAPRGFIACGRAHWLRLISPVIRSIPVKFSVGISVPGAVRLETAFELEPANEPLECRREMPALITFTSGSTDAPKPAVRTHRFLEAQHGVLSKYLRLAAGEVDLTTLPIFALANLASGVTTVIPNADLRTPGAVDGKAICEQIQRHRASRIGAAPAFLERLAESSEQTGRTLPRLTKVFTGGGPVFPNLLERLRNLAPEAEITAVYGSTEAEPIAVLAYRDISAEEREAMSRGRGLLAGVPVAELELRIECEEGGGELINGNRTSDDQRVGEILVRGQHVLSGKNWHRTGDAGYVDQRGRLWLMGRCCARIEDERGTVYPFSVECAAQQLLGVRRAALVSVRGRRVLAIERDGGARPVDSGALIPSLELDEVRLIRRIPVDRRHNSKIDYPALRRRLGAERKVRAPARGSECRS